MAELIILSPHFDDAVFDCWHAINQPQATVVTVFAGLPEQGTTTLWDRLCGQADSRKMVSMRIKENNAALRETSASIKNLDFLDNQYHSAKISIDEIVKIILASTPSDSSYLAPLAGSHLFRHPDHVMLRDVGVMIKGLGKKVCFYPDLPYMSIPKNAKPQYLQKLSEQASKLLGFPVSATAKKLSQGELAAKNRAMSSYASQFNMTNITSIGRLSILAKRDYEVILQPDN